MPCRWAKGSVVRTAGSGTCCAGSAHAARPCTSRWPRRITAAQYSMLSVADAEPGLSGAELSRDTMLTPQSVNATEGLGGEQRMVASLTEAEQATFRRHLTDCALARNSRSAAGPPAGHDRPDHPGPGARQGKGMR